MALASYSLWSQRGGRRRRRRLKACSCARCVVSSPCMLHVWASEQVLNSYHHHHHLNSCGCDIFEEAKVTYVYLCHITINDGMTRMHTGKTRFPVSVKWPTLFFDWLFFSMAGERERGTNNWMPACVSKHFGRWQWPPRKWHKDPTIRIDPKSALCQFTLS